MVDRGYEVWFNNSRGVTYSNKNKRDGEWSLREKWDFTFADMGIYDLPASILKILDVSGAEQVTVVGHSQGTSQMWYGMSHKQDFFAKYVNRFISLASCTIPEPYPMIPLDYKGITSLFLKTDKIGVYSVFSKDESSMSIFGLFCVVLENPIICLSESFNVVELMIEWGLFFADAQSMTSFLYYGQLIVEKQF